VDESLTGGFLYRCSVLLPDWEYQKLQEPWQRLGDTFLTVSPGSKLIWTSDADLIRQVTSRREDFPKPLESYEILGLFGTNVVTTEGALWRLHRKATSASFNEKNAAHTFRETINQTQGMVRQWEAQEHEKGGDATIRTIELDTMTWALNIISYVGFGLRLLWPGQETPKDVDPRMRKYGERQPPPGHSMTFAGSIATVLHYLVVLLILPRWLLGTYSLT